MDTSSTMESCDRRLFYASPLVCSNKRAPVAHFDAVAEFLAVTPPYLGPQCRWTERDIEVMATFAYWVARTGVVIFAGDPKNMSPIKL